ncbi:hypothetical protein OTB20_15190 [Streptomyces sp. H27-H1]|nr:hypothetical protein [Streptomyces sp. H27-H1]MCY0927531.1 hypothetical protein [Streptomyces sp. H27-H1]
MRGVRHLYRAAGVREVLTPGGDVSEIFCDYSAMSVTCPLGRQAVVKP